MTPLCFLFEASPSVRYALQIMLHTIGFNVVTAEGVLPPDVVLQGSPSLIVLGDLPGGSPETLTFLTVLKGHPALSQIPILVCTSSDRLVDKINTDGERDKCTALLKPLSRHELAAAIAVLRGGIVSHDRTKAAGDIVQAAPRNVSEAE